MLYRFIQHAEGKTIIAPYSVRGNEDALVAAPIYWHEVTRELRPESFPLTVIQDRIKQVGDPFKEFFFAKGNQPISPVIQALKEKSL